MEIKNKKDFVKVLFDLIEDEQRFLSVFATLDNLYGRGSITEKMFDDWKEEAIERIKG